MTDPHDRIDLERIWQSFVNRLGISAERPSYTFDPLYYSRKYPEAARAGAAYAHFDRVGRVQEHFPNLTNEPTATRRPIDDMLCASNAGQFRFPTYSALLICPKRGAWATGRGAKPEISQWSARSAFANEECTMITLKATGVKQLKLDRGRDWLKWPRQLSITNLASKREQNQSKYRQSSRIFL